MEWLELKPATHFSVSFLVLTVHHGLPPGSCPGAENSIELALPPKGVERAEK